MGNGRCDNRSANVFFIADTDINGHIPITDGSFNYTHGYGLDGTVVRPTGSRSMDHLFRRRNFARVRINIYCSTQNRGNYIATLVVPDAGSTLP